MNLTQQLKSVTYFPLSHYSTCFVTLKRRMRDVRCASDAFVRGTRNFKYICKR